MIRLPEINKRNWKKVLRELDLKKYPSLPPNLETLRDRILVKDELSFADEALGFARLTRYFQDFQSEINSLYIQTIDYKKFDKRPPMEHQKAGVEFLLKNNRCILGDDMGMGKSITTIYAALAMEDKHKILVITLKSLKYNFAKEVGYLDDRVAIVDKKWETSKFTIVHYDALNKYHKEILSGGFTIMILDEAHKCKNKKAKRSILVNEFITSLSPLKLWLLTGTPLDNRPMDYYPLLKMIKHPVSKNWVKYAERYCNGKIDQWGRWDVKGASNLKELYDLTQTTFLRRLKTSLGADLPQKYRKPVFLELKNKKGYNKVITDYKEKKFQDIIKEFGYEGDVDDVGVEEMTKLMLHRQFCAMEKIEDGSLFELIDNILEEDPTNKIIVFTNFRRVIDAVLENYGDTCLFIDGRILDSKKRLQTMEEFNTDPDKSLIAMNIAAGGTGMNGQGANYVIVNDMEWRPTSMIQAEDRAYRIGQKRDVNVLYPVYDNTVESILYDTIERKMKIISTVVEGESEKYFEETVLIDDKQAMKDERKSIIEAILAQL